MDELHSDFNKLKMEEGEQVHLKLDLSLKNKLIKKLNEHSQLGLLAEDGGVKTVEENNRIIASLDSLPVLIEEDESRSLVQNEDALKFFKGIEFVKLKLGVFDVRKHNIVGWFKKFEFYSDLLAWSGAQRVDGLVHLLEHGLDRVACVEKPEYEQVKRDVVDAVTGLAAKDSNTNFWQHYACVFKIFDQYKFTNPERKFWIGCLTSASYLIDSLKNPNLVYTERVKELRALI